VKPRRITLEGISPIDAHGQLWLAIGPRVSHVPPEPPAHRPLGDRAVKRTSDLDEILWMRDIVQLTGKHRCTIHRWMNLGLFPQKNVPRGRPEGWLRSTIELWLLGSPSTTGGKGSRHAPLR
jgi:predicted DNA-binding transcriptional regulator AlpA